MEDIREVPGLTCSLCGDEAPHRNSTRTDVDRYIQKNINLCHKHTYILDDILNILSERRHTLKEIKLIVAKQRLFR